MLSITNFVKSLFYVAPNNSNEHFETTPTSTKPYIWLYWENKPGVVNRPVYLDLCLRTIIKHCSDDFQVVLLNEQSVYTYLPNLRKDLDKYCNIPQKADYIRLCLLYSYGGIWLDSDVIMLKSPKIYYDYLDKGYDYVGFGCYYDHCEQSMYGFPKPANWVMIANKQSKLITMSLLKATNIINNNPERLKQNYHCLGKDLLFECISVLLDNPGWNYKHISSRCVERISNGKKMTNDMLLSNVEIDTECKNNFVFVPCYNTAPSFPTWFLELDEEHILSMNSLISRLFRKSLAIEK